MRHHNRNSKFGRERNQRRAFLRGLATSLLERGKITVTETRAKALRPFVEKLITASRAETNSSRRLVAKRLGGVKAGKKLFSEIAPRHQKRPGGYTRIIKLPPRRKDGSKMAVIEII